MNFNIIFGGNIAKLAQQATLKVYSSSKHKMVGGFPTLRLGCGQKVLTKEPACYKHYTGPRMSTGVLKIHEQR